MLNLIPRPNCPESTGAELFRPGSATAGRAAGPGAADALELFKEYTGTTAGTVFTAHGEPAFENGLPTDESYRLTVDGAGVRLDAPNRFGLLRGVQTLRTLRTPDGAYPHVVIDRDAPLMRWRGMMIDTARHFRTVAELEKLIDAFAALKFNLVHLHLTDDQGWRVEIKKYPRLTEIGGRRPFTLTGHESARPRRYDNTPHEGFYTQEDLRGLVAFAARRGVAILPEIDLPGHMQAAIAAYPELGCLRNGYVPTPRCHWGISEHILNPFPETIDFLTGVLAEVAAIFPFEYMHIGGDEALKNQWSDSPAVQTRMAELGIASETEMQGWITARMSEFLAAHGRRLIGWDEILEGPLSPGDAVMSWRGENGALAAARAGRFAVNASSGHVYFDYYQADPATEPLAIGGDCPLEKVYRYTAVPKTLEPGNAHWILGGQGQLWAEYLPTAAQMEYMAFPRAAALAEKLWTAPERCDYADFYRRLAGPVGFWQRAGIRFHPVP